jgi:hypothetical protein
MMRPVIRRVAALAVRLALAAAPAVAQPAIASEPAPIDPAAARPAFLRVESNPGAFVQVDGAPAFPAASASGDLSAGVRNVRVYLSGYMSRTEHVRLAPGETRTLIAPLSPKTRTGAIVRAAIFPGWGARYMEKPRSARILGAAGLATLAGTFGFEAMLDGRIDTYEERQREYRSTVDPGAIEAAFRAQEEAYDDVESAETLRDVFRAALVGTCALSVAQAIFRFPWSSERVEVGARFDAPAPLARGGSRIALVTYRLP